MRARLTTAQMQAMTKESLMQRVLALQTELDRTIYRAQQYGEALETMGYFANSRPTEARHNRKAPNA